ncbi:MAG: OmpA family protein, partial [Chitinophagaceae bacterium]
FYSKGDYYSAAQYYEKHLGGKTLPGSGYEPYLIQKKTAGAGQSSKAELLYKLAESYRLLNDYAHAEQYYKALLDEDAAAYPLATYYYGVSLRANGKYAEAQQQLELFLSKYTTADAYQQQAKQELANLQFIQQQLSHTSTLTKIEKLNGNINKDGASYAAGWLDANTLAFTATRADSSNKKKVTHDNALYSAALKDGGFEEAAKLNMPVADGNQQGVASFLPGGNTVFLTGWKTDAQGKKSSAIYSSEKQGDNYSVPVLLHTNINVEGSNTRQPQVTDDGKYLLFASDRPGGQGGFDIWYAPLDSKGQPGKAVNMGTGINTARDEEAPFYHIAAQSLVFASNGLTGMGGFDLYAAKGTIGSSFGAPENLGAPINSIKDDIYFVSKGKRLLENAWISSDRSSLCCLELFSVQKTYQQYYTGKVVDCAGNTPLAGVSLEAQDASGKSIGTLITDATGSYTFQTAPGGGLLITGSKADYNKVSFTTADGNADTITSKDVCLSKTPVAVKELPALDTSHVLFAFNEAQVATDYLGYLDKVAAWLKENPEVSIEIAAYTDGLGTKAYNLKLSQERANACLDYLVKAGVEKDRLKAKGYGECCPLVPETTDGKDNEAARQQNRRVEIKKQ